MAQTKVTSQHSKNFDNKATLWSVPCISFPAPRGYETIHHGTKLKSTCHLPYMNMHEGGDSSLESHSKARRFHCTCDPMSKKTHQAGDVRRWLLRLRYTINDKYSIVGRIIVTSYTALKKKLIRKYFPFSWVCRHIIAFGWVTERTNIIQL